MYNRNGQTTSFQFKSCLKTDNLCGHVTKTFSTNALFWGRHSATNIIRQTVKYTLKIVERSRINFSLIVDWGTNCLFGLKNACVKNHLVVNRNCDQLPLPRNTTFFYFTVLNPLFLYLSFTSSHCAYHERIFDLILLKLFPLLTRSLKIISTCTSNFYFVNKKGRVKLSFEFMWSHIFPSHVTLEKFFHDNDISHVSPVEVTVHLYNTQTVASCCEVHMLYQCDDSGIESRKKKSQAQASTFCFKFHSLSFKFSCTSPFQ